jgi:hypothetical protein
MTLESASTVGIRTLRVTLLDTRLTNPREAWGQALQLWQWTQADDTRAELFLWTYVTESSVLDPPCVASYYCLIVCSLKPTDIKKEPPSTTIGGCRASQEGFWGGVPMLNSQDHAHKTHHLPEWGVPGIRPGGRRFRWECLPTTLVAVTNFY